MRGRADVSVVAGVIVIPQIQVICLMHVRTKLQRGCIQSACLKTVVRSAMFENEFHVKLSSITKLIVCILHDI